MKILLVFTGGTIGSTVSEGTIDTSGNAPFKLLHLFEQNYPKHQQLHFDTLQPLQILSENLAPTAWTTIINAIEKADPSQYDGIIITHGTDTLAYSAAALSFYFHALKQPILLVSSNYPLDDDRANGLDNFICAVEFIRQQIATGVFVPYRNPQQTMQVHQGNRLACSLQLSGDFFSVQGNSAMQFEEGGFVKLTPSAKRPEISIAPLTSNFSDRILMIKPYPGLDYRHFDLENVDAVLHDLYHSGTACASLQWGAQHSLIEFIKRCKAENVPIYLAPAIHSPDAYQSTLTLLEHGAQMLWNLSIEAVYVKLALAYGNFTDQQQILAFMTNDIAGEHIG
ncbi:MAG: asparaginase domain-containing protein [Methylococcales bacterium]|nr:asparaginase domain-containing protein [Methylococcales bacterium]